MKVYSYNVNGWLAQLASNVSVGEAYTIIRAEIKDLPIGRTGNIVFCVEEKDQTFDIGTTWDQLGGDSTPVENVNAEVMPLAVQGDHALFLDTNLAIAEEVFEDYEFLQLDGDQTTPEYFMVWGKLKVSQTDYYTPASNSRNAHYFRIADDDSNWG